MAGYARRQPAIMRDMKSRASGVATGLAWVGAVVAGSTLVWTVIARAGAQVGAEVPQALPVASSSRTPAATAAVPAASTSITSSTTSASTASEASTALPTRSSPAPRRTWVGPGGRVVAYCDAAGVHGTATPDGGWTVTAKADGGEYEAKFRRDGSDEVEVVASCSSGEVSFRLKD